MFLGGLQKDMEHWARKPLGFQSLERRSVGAWRKKESVKKIADDGGLACELPEGFRESPLMALSGPFTILS